MVLLLDSYRLTTDVCSVKSVAQGGGSHKWVHFESESVCPSVPKADSPIRVGADQTTPTRCRCGKGQGGVGNLSRLGSFSVAIGRGAEHLVDVVRDGLVLERKSVRVVTQSCRRVVSNAIQGAQTGDELAAVALLVQGVG